MGDTVESKGRHHEALHPGAKHRRTFPEDVGRPRASAGRLDILGGWAPGITPSHPTLFLPAARIDDACHTALASSNLLLLLLLLFRPKPGLQIRLRVFCGTLWLKTAERYVQLSIRLLGSITMFLLRELLLLPPSSRERPAASASVILPVHLVIGSPPPPPPSSSHPTQPLFSLLA